MSLPETLDPSPARAVPPCPLIPLFPGLSGTAQIDETAPERAVRVGFRFVICGRPDGAEATVGETNSERPIRATEAVGHDRSQLRARLNRPEGGPGAIVGSGC